MDKKDAISAKAFKFIETALMKGDSVLIHSLRGQNRAGCLLAAYLIHKYLISFTPHDIDIDGVCPRRSSFCATAVRASASVPPFSPSFSTLRIVCATGQERSLPALGTVSPLSSPSVESANEKDGEELILRNTFLNARKNVPATPEKNVSPPEGAKKVRWNDAENGSLTCVIPRRKTARGTRKSPGAKRDPKPIIKKVHSTAVPAGTMSTADSSPAVHPSPFTKEVPEMVTLGEAELPEKRDENLSATDFLDELETADRSPPKVALVSDPRRRLATNFHPLRLHTMFGAGRELPTSTALPMTQHRGWRDQVGVRDAHRPAEKDSPWGEAGRRECETVVQRQGQEGEKGSGDCDHGCRCQSSQVKTHELIRIDSSG